MRRLAAFIALTVASTFVCGVHAQSDKSQIIKILPDKIEWEAAPPGEIGVKGATLTGPLTTRGFYTRRVHLAQGGMVAPHTHPDTRYVTVLSGELFIGQGDTMDPATASRYPAGSYIVIPAGMAHYSLAIGGEAEYQESGIGPTATNFLKK